MLIKAIFRLDCYTCRVINKERCMKPITMTATMLASVSLLAGCGGGGDGGNEPMFATFNLSVSDAPVNGARAVMVCFNEVELTGNGLGSQSFTIGDRSEE